MSSGTPMILGGDELGRSQRGNNNAWCQDSPTSWLDWRPTAAAQELRRFFERLIRLRQDHAVLRPRRFDRPLGWHGTRPHQPDWSTDSRALAMHAIGDGVGDVLVLVNASPHPARFQLVDAPADTAWRRAVDTARPAPDDIVEPGAAEALDEPGRYRLEGRACAVLVSVRCAAR